MKLFYDYFPIICFFIAYKLFGIYVATATTIAASALQVGVYWLIHRSYEKMHLITLILIVVLGGTTLLLHNPIFIQWKPSIIYWLFAIALLISQFFGKKNLIEHMMADKIKAPKKIWTHIAYAWSFFFLILGGINIYVVYHYDMNAWVNFKLFGTLIATLIFAILQAIYISRHVIHDEEPQQ